MPVKPIPDGYRAVTPYLIVADAAKLIDFLKAGFEAKEVQRSERPDGSVMHAEVRIADSLLMIGEARGEWQPMPTTLYLYVPNTDATYHRAVAAGGVSLFEPMDQFYGDRQASVRDPSGNIWWIATHIEDVPPQEVERRAAAFAAKQGG